MIPGSKKPLHNIVRGNRTKTASRRATEARGKVIRRRVIWHSAHERYGGGRRH